MAENSGIEWTDNTLNFWIGCTKVSPACDHCYAEYQVSTRWKKKWPDAWNGQCYRTAPSTWNQVFRWDRKAAADRPALVFCNSWSDYFDNQVPVEWRAEAWRYISVTPNLTWLILTKRPQNIRKMLPEDWGGGYPNVWLGTTIENRFELERRAPILAAVPCAKRFWSVEPLLEDLGDLGAYLPGVDWIIAGGESGPRFRDMEPAWARSVRDQCRSMEVPFFLKQMSGRWPKQVPIPADLTIREFPK